MKLKQKHFIPFMLVLAGITTIGIIISSFSFKNKQQVEFEENVAVSDSLLTMELPRIGQDGMLKLNEWQGEEQVLVFWASWSEKSEALMKEITQFSAAYDDSSLQIIAALVMDVTESKPDPSEFPGFIYVDGTRLYNHLKVPGIPTYIYLKRGKVAHTHVGYEIGAGLDTLKAY
ncbi:TlpA family protein disulfide reductase [Balneola sp. MJW-20]|uniref:TlpA family protein disulfide reductase n=1 Tax=Gracilimonas aurantiaca TaxID=3234185 RepID=UPI0034651528